ncbi:MAG TPA: endolytic transglycosylase MltG [Candidatus Anaerobutyricum stercoris]|uniref:Endolytic transglycosylase MltG n=1 Tax=Candidatus Anaerobutyricum stercoris TaxID=2838457 RepID=A0A9D2ENF1_9FIRM|nr:YceG-like family protein [Eubacteriaceae bacterium CHKCI004]HIZ40590.1 endolytic transglycosylase MltG [Candidatus Anaerobutyricum stercoris]
MYRKHGGRLTVGDAKDKKEKIREGADIMANKVIRIIVKTLFYIFIGLLLVYLFVQMRQIGYQIFSDRAKDSPEVAKEMVLTVTEDESLMEIGRDLAGKDIIENAYIFAAALRCSEGYQNIQPGEYVINSAQRPSEILATLTHIGEQEEE